MTWCLAFAMLIASTAVQAKPAWTSGDTIRRSGDSVAVLCEGRDVAKDLAYQQALHRCNALASEQVKAAKFQVRSVVVGSESEAPKLYEEVSSHWQVEGLIPKPIHEYTEPDGSEQVVTLEVQYDLRQVTLADAATVEPKESLAKAESTFEFQSYPAKTSTIDRKQFRQSSQRTIVLTSIPKCDRIFVESTHPRSIACTSNPMMISINSQEDRELLIQAKDISKRVKINADRSPSSFHETENLEVTLEVP